MFSFEIFSCYTWIDFSSYFFISLSSTLIYSLMEQLNFFLPKIFLGFFIISLLFLSLIENYRRASLLDGSFPYFDWIVTYLSLSYYLGLF